MHLYSSQPAEVTPSAEQAPGTTSDAPATELHQPEESTASAIEPADVIEIEDTPSPPALPVASTSATTLDSTTLDFVDTSLEELEFDSATHWSSLASTFEDTPSARNVWKEGLEDFEF